MKVPVLFPKIFDHPFTYKSEIPEKLSPGDFVKAPFGSKEITGVIWTDEQKTTKKFTGNPFKLQGRRGLVFAMLSKYTQGK